MNKTFTRATRKAHGFVNGQIIDYAGTLTSCAGVPIVRGRIYVFGHDMLLVPEGSDYVPTGTEGWREINNAVFEGAAKYLGGPATKFWARPVEDDLDYIDEVADATTAMLTKVEAAVANVAASLATIEPAPAEVECDCGFLYDPTGLVVCPSCRMAPSPEADPSSEFEDGQHEIEDDGTEASTIEASRLAIREQSNRVEAARGAWLIEREKLMAMVEEASPAISEYILAAEADVTRKTIRSWLGKG